MRYGCLCNEEVVISSKTFYCLVWNLTFICHFDFFGWAPHREGFISLLVWQMIADVGYFNSFLYISANINIFEICFYMPFSILFVELEIWINSRIIYKIYPTWSTFSTGWHDLFSKWFISIIWILEAIIHSVNCTAI